MASSRERDLNETPRFHKGRLVVLPAKSSMLVFDKQHGIVFTPLELMQRQNAYAGCFPVIVHELVLEDRLVQGSL